MRQLLRFLLPVLIGILVMHHVQAQSESEPNNTAATANTIILNTTYAGNINPAGESDWYKITTATDGRLSFTLTPNTAKYTWIYIYDFNGTTVLASGNGNSNFTVSADGLAAGTYYAKVMGYFNNETSSYTLSASLSAPVQAGDPEPNGIKATAVLLAVNSSASGHVGYLYNNKRDTLDWYRITIPADGLVKLKLTSANSYYVSARLFDNDGTTQLNYLEAQNNTTTVSTDGLAAGSYYVQINAYYNNQFVPYVLTDSLITPVQANDVEPNGTRALAQNLPVNSTTTGHIGYLYNNKRDTLDWYKVTIPADGLIKLKLTSANNYYVSARLFDNDGISQLGYLEAANNTTTASVDGLAAGTYYVQINAYYNNQFVPYVLTDSLITPVQANDVEPNGTRALAHNLPVHSTTTGHIGYLYNNKRDTLDWYTITIPADGLVKLKLTSANNYYVSARLFDGDGITQLNYLEAQNKTTAVSTDGLAAGKYYVQVNAYYNNQFVPYVLTDSLYATASNDPEPNDSKATALTLPINSAASGHVGYLYNNKRDSSDWYKLNTTADGAIKLKITSANNNYVSVRLFDSNGTTQLNYAEAANGTAAVSTDGLAAGTYYVKVNAYYNNQIVPYTVADSLYTYNPVDAEPNKYFKQAMTMVNNGVQTGHVGFYYNNQRDTADIFKINYTGSGSLGFTLDLLPHIVDGSLNYVWLQVFRDTAAAPVYNNNFAAATTQINLAGFAQGIYYVKIFGYYNNQFQAYAITNRFTDANIARIVVIDSKTTTTSNSCGGDSITYALSGGIAPYTVRLYRNSAAYDSVVTAAGSVTFKNLPPGIYHATVYGDGASSFGSSAVLSLLPPVPGGLVKSAVTTTGCQLGWSTIICANGYTMQHKKTGTTAWTSTPATNNTLTLSGLSSNTLYTWRVAASQTSTITGQVVVSAFSDTANFMTSSALPVNFLLFDGIVRNGDGVLRWQTTDEINNKGFYIERSSDGLQFSSIGFVGAKTGSTIIDYGFSDNHMPAGKTYYRLKQSDLDGAYSYSKTISLQLVGFAWSVTGNPVTNGNTALMLQLDKLAQVTLTIASIDGRLLERIDKGWLPAGNYRFPVNLDKAVAGVYLLRLTVGKNQYTTKLLKQ